MTDERSGRELTPRDPDQPVRPDSAITPVPEADRRAVERFSAGPRAHSVGLTEERGAQIVRQSGNARNVVFLALLVIAIFIPVYWFYESGIPAVGAEGRLEREAQVQYVTDVARGYELYIANCARCHGEEGQGGIGPPLNDQAKLYNALTPGGDPGAGHLNPEYIDTVLTVGGRYICGDPQSLMPAWRQPDGPLNYRQIEELIAWLTASDETVFEYDPAAHGLAADAEHAEPVMVRGWRDHTWEPEPGATPPPACWRAPADAAGPAVPSGTPALIEPGTPDAPRVIPVEATGRLQFLDENGAPLTQITVVDGETVTFEVENTAGFDHNFYIGTEEQLMVPDGTTEVGIPAWMEGVQTLTWTVGVEADAALQFACTVPGHYPLMHGDIVVQQADGA